MAQRFQSVFLRAQSESEVNGFISRHLQPDEDFSSSCGVAVDRLVRYLHSVQTELPIKVRSVIKGGSLGKGTALKNKSDIDCVVFINYDGGIQTSIQAMSGPWLQDIIEEIRHSLGNWNPLPEFEVVGKTIHAVKLRYKKGSFTCDVDLLPAIDILKKGTPQQVYYAMKSLSPHLREYCSAPLVQLQVEFVKCQQPVVKDLIRFVKHWKNEYSEKVFREFAPPHARLPSSYLLELLCIKVWEMVGRPSSMDKRQGLKAVMSLLTERRHHVHRVEWSAFYDPSKYPLKATDHLSVRDPANPFNDLCSDFDAFSWNTIDYMKIKTLKAPLFDGLRMDPPWNIFRD
ncbi:2'-5'-oligoadenylate synthase 3-like [Lingula anatina]|uniref:2'-5'-oligoadenylate synthase 3-like n=1 Tax=Lingula anatina TaxID=7574 RepID=A0A1S3JE37_LINAN|nr:2'-5'-oligoadenylate synthase 3-like [Lingula anatina]|eukprot:XP_013408680.1 2'-5'-oligoadenylate synthase 3-like [Lingula anatina]